MAATFLNSAPQGGDRVRETWRISNKRPRGQRRREPEASSFLSKATDHKFDAEDETETGVEMKQDSFLQPSCDIGKERAHESHGTKTDALKHEPHGGTMGSKDLLSPTTRNSSQTSPPAPHRSCTSTTNQAAANQSQRSSAPSTPNTTPQRSDDMVLPPHLRPRKAPSTLQTSKDTPTRDPTATSDTHDHTPNTMPPKRNTKDKPEPIPVQSNGKAKLSQPTPPSSETLCIDIRQKLEHDHGVKVDDPKPSTASPKSLVPHPDLGQGEERHANDDTSKPMTRSRRAGPKTTVSTQGDVAKQKDSEKPQSKRGAGTASRGRGKFPGPPPFVSLRTQRWPKNSEMRADAHRWDIKWDDESQGKSKDSARANSGSGEKKEKRKDIDSETGFKLTGWDGDWAPAPVNWDARPAFRDHQSAEKIELWMVDAKEGKKVTAESITIGELTAVTGEYGEIAPRYWVPIIIGKQAPQTFWNELMRSTEPGPDQEGDLDGALPWWEFYESKDGNLLKPREHPKIEGVDPDESQNERLARENDYGSNEHTENRKCLEKAKRDAEREKRKRAQEKVRKLSKQLPPSEGRQPIKPGLKIYLRSARPTDMKAIRDIYNYYIQHTVSTPEMTRRTLADMEQRCNEIVRNKLPFLVACQRGDVLKSRRKKHAGEEVILPETIAGFATADDYNDMLGTYRFTAEVEVYVDKDQYMKGVGKCLLDKLIGMLDPEYIERGGFDTEGEELEGVGPSRLIQNIIVNLPYDADKPTRLGWVGKWLSEWIGFEQVGDLKKIGLKDGKNVNLAIFQRTTGANIDASNAPINLKSYPK